MIDGMSGSIEESNNKSKEADKEDSGYMMAQMMKQFGNMGGDMPAPKQILQINPNHKLIKKLSDSADVALIDDAAHVLLDQAKLYEGEALTDTAGFIARLNRIMAKAL